MLQKFFFFNAMASLKTIAARQKKNAKLIHLLLELASKFGLNIDENILKQMTF
jgi:hypothetical protein